MEGEGVINYSINKKPTYAYTNATTQFDDELMKRNIVTKEQVLLAKGMCVDDATKLIQLSTTTTTTTKESNHTYDWTEKEQQKDNGNRYDSDDDNDSDDDDGEFLNDDNDEFVQRYREMRIEEELLKKQNSNNNFLYGEVIYINRTEWKYHVNDASQNGTWVIVCLISSDTDRTGCIERSIKELAKIYNHIKFVFIASNHAIEKWPQENLPSLFLYRFGIMQYELIRLPININTEQVQLLLQEKSVL